MDENCLLLDLLEDLGRYFDLVLAKYASKQVNPFKGGYVVHTGYRMKFIFLPILIKIF